MTQNPQTHQTAAEAPVLSIEGLTVGFPNERGTHLTPVVRNASFAVRRNEIVGLVGESGSGKTQTSLAVLRLTRPPGRILSGRILVNGQDVVGMSEEQIRQIRGSKAAMIFQSPRTSLNPLMTVGKQIGRVYARHRRLGKQEAEEAALTMLRQVGIAGPERVAKSYPHQLSGGMAQRVMIAMMLGCGPELLIADEPTTGLDVTIQAQIFELIKEVQADTKMSVLLITHDLGVVAEVCHRMVVMQMGRVVEIGPVGELFAEPLHPYTARLLGSILRPDLPPDSIPSRASSSQVTFAVDGVPYQAVAVDSWQELQVGPPELVQVSPERWVLAHRMPAMAEAVA